MEQEENEHSNVDAFFAHLENESTRDFGDCDAYEIRGKHWAIQIGDNVGSAWLEVDLEDETMLKNRETAFEFKVLLGPVNAKKLIKFLRALPPEPDDDEKPSEAAEA